jgi:hypothetical protein
MRTITGNFNPLADMCVLQINSDSVTKNATSQSYLLFTVVKSNVGEVSNCQIDRPRH